MSLVAPRTMSKLLSAAIKMIFTHIARKGRRGVLLLMWKKIIMFIVLKKKEKNQKIKNMIIFIISAPKCRHFFSWK